jgi:hypothetical protein
MREDFVSRLIAGAFPAEGSVDPSTEGRPPDGGRFRGCCSLSSTKVKSLRDSTLDLLDDATSPLEETRGRNGSPKGTRDKKLRRRRLP